MTPHILRIPWAGPAVALALLFSTVDARPARAQPVGTAGAVAAAAAPVDVLCLTESYEFGKALAAWSDAWDQYELSLPGGTASEIQDAVDQLDQATTRVVDTGVKLAACLVKYLI